jgi:hypothetical protein
MTYVIRSLGLVGGAVVATGSDKGFVSKYDPSAYLGRGDIAFTWDVDKAIKFASQAEIFAFIMQVPPDRPTREDGRPNKPISAFNLVIEPMEKAGGRL